MVKKIKKILSIFLCLTFINIPVLADGKISQDINKYIKQIKDVLENDYKISKDLANKYLSEINKIAKRFEEITPKKTNTINNYMVVKLKDLDKDNIPELFIMYCDSSEETYYDFAHLKVFSKNGLIFDKAFSLPKREQTPEYKPIGLNMYISNDGITYFLVELMNTDTFFSGALYKLENGVLTEEVPNALNYSEILWCEKYKNANGNSYCPHTICYINEDLKLEKVSVNTHQEAYDAINLREIKLGEGKISEYMKNKIENYPNIIEKYELVNDSYMYKECINNLPDFFDYTSAYNNLDPYNVTYKDIKNYLDNNKDVKILKDITNDN